MLDRTTTLLAGAIVAFLSVLLVFSFVALSRSFWAEPRFEPVRMAGEMVPDIAERFPKGDALLPPSSSPTHAPQADTLIPQGVSAGVIDRLMKTVTIKKEPPPPVKVTEVEEDPPEYNGYEKRHDICSHNGGHRVDFRRHRHIMWRCEYPRRRRR